MKNRIAGMIGTNKAFRLWMGTFHSIFGKILRFEAAATDFSSNYTIYDQQDSRNLVKRILKQKNLDPKQYPPNMVHNRISAAKNQLITANAYQNNSALIAQDRQQRRPYFAEVYHEYSKQCRISDVRDFDDLLLHTYLLFKKHPEVLQKYQKMFKYFLVDEYQDTNHAQYLIIKELSKAHKNICVVGDDAQSIYAFRGARIENILNFKKDYPDDYKEYKLEQNYRSTQNIVNAANSLIWKNKKQFFKKVFSKKEQGEKIKVSQLLTDYEEAHYIAGRMLELHNTNHTPYSEFAVLYRTNAQSRVIEESMRKRNIPYRIYGGLSFYQRKEIKDAIAYLRLTINHKDAEAFKRIVNYPSRKIGKTTIEKLEKAAVNLNTTIWDLASHPENLGADLNKATRSKLQNFTLQINEYSRIAEEMGAFEIAEKIIKDTGIYKELYNDKSPEGISRFENIDELLNGIKDFVDQQQHENPNIEVKLEDYLQNVSLLTSQDEEKDSDTDKVSLMTLHSAKGLEFDYVFIGGVEEELFPGKMATFSESELNEERRLLYVGITRARKLTELCHAHSRYRYGSMQMNPPSRFIDDIDPRFIETESPKSPSDSLDAMFEEQKPGTYSRKKNYNTRRISNTHTTQSPPSPGRKLRRMPRGHQDIGHDTVSADAGKIKPGNKVKHARFGKGIVKEVDGAGANMKAKVEFNAYGEKTLLLKFAQLQILD